MASLSTSFFFSPSPEVTIIIYIERTPVKLVSTVASNKTHLYASSLLASSFESTESSNHPNGMADMLSSLIKEEINA